MFFAALRYSSVTSSHAAVTKWLHPIGWAARRQGETRDGRPAEPPVINCRRARQGETQTSQNYTSVRNTISGITMRIGGMTIFGMFIFGMVIGAMRICGIVTGSM